MNSFITDLISKYGYLAVFFLIFLENLFPPIPSEVILLFGGFMTVAAGLGTVPMVVFSVLGSLAGALALYFIGYKLGYSGVLKFFTGKAGKALGLERNDLTRTNDWFHRRGNQAVFLCRFVPLLRSLISVPAGIAKMDMKIFLILTAIGSAIWNTVIIFLGRVAGENWIAWEKEISKYSDYFVYIFGGVLALFIIYKIVKRKKAVHIPHDKIQEKNGDTQDKGNINTVSETEKPGEYSGK